MALEVLDNLNQIRHFADGGTTADPIAGLYTSVLGRAPDAAGLSYWQNALASGTSLSDIQSAFQASPEAQAKAATPTPAPTTAPTLTPTPTPTPTPAANNTSAITQMYQQYLGRTPDTAGLAYWQQQADSGTPLSQIQSAIASSQEATTSPTAQAAQITDIYKTDLGRAPDTAGLSYWEQQATSGVPISQIKAAILGSQEGIATPAGETQAITQAYQDALGRAPDAAGLAFYQKALASGTPLSSIISDIKNSAEAKNRASASQTVATPTPTPTPTQTPTDIADNVKWVDDPNSPSGTRAIYTDPNTGVQSYVSVNPDTNQFEITSTILTADAANDPFVQASGMQNSDPASAQAFHNLKTTDPNAYYTQAAKNIQNQIFEAWTNNQGDITSQYQPLLDEIKANDPQAYYATQLALKGQQVGWEIGQNTSQRNASTIADIQSLASDAQKAGLSASQVNSIVSQNVNQANAQNQQRIISEQQMGGPGFNFGKDFLPGIEFVGGLAAAAAAPELLGAIGLAPETSAIGSGIATGMQSGATMGGINAAIKGGDIAQGVGVGTLTGGITGGAVSGLASSLTSLGLPAAASTPTASAIVGAARSVIAGQDPTKALENAGIGAVLSGLGSQALPVLTNNGIPASVANVLIGAVAGGTSAAIKGGNLTAGIESGAIGSLVGQGLNAGKNLVNSLSPTNPDNIALGGSGGGGEFTPTDGNSFTLPTTNIITDTSPNPLSSPTTAGLTQEEFDAIQKQNIGNVFVPTEYAPLAQALPSSFATDYMPTTPLVQTGTPQTGLSNVYGAASNDPQSIARTVQSLSAKPGIDEYTNTYSSLFDFSAQNQNYLNDLIDAYNKDPSYAPYANEIQKLVTQYPNLANDQTDQILKNTVTPEPSGIGLTQNVDAYRPTEPLTDLQIKDYLGQGATQNDIENLIKQYGYSGNNPEYSALPKPTETPSYPALPTPEPAVPSPNSPANDPNIAPEPKVPGIPLTPIVPVSPPGPTPQQPVVPGQTPSTSPTPRTSPAPATTPEPGTSPTPATTPEPGTSPTPATTPEPGIKIQPGDIVKPGESPTPEQLTNAVKNVENLINSGTDPVEAIKKIALTTNIPATVLEKLVSVAPATPVTPVTSVTPSVPVSPTTPVKPSVTIPATPVTPNVTTPATPVTPNVATPVSPKITTPATPVAPNVATPAIVGQSIVQNPQGIYDLTPGLTKARTDYELAGHFHMASGGSVATTTGTDPFGLNQYTSQSGGIYDASSPFVGSTMTMPKLTIGETRKNPDYNIPAYNPVFKADGGIINHQPQFFSEGGLGSLENRYVKGDGDGTSDDVPAMLANGEFVIPADVVSALGNGSNDSGAAVLDHFLQTIRKHKQKHDAKHLPPDSKGPLAYLLEAKKKA